jgi:hypothetical protein
MAISLAALFMKTLMLAETLAIALSLSLSLSLSLNPSASQVNLNAIPSGASEVDPNAISLPPVPMHLLVGERIPKELLPLFLCVTSRDCRKTSCQMVNSDHIEARMR